MIYAEITNNVIYDIPCGYGLYVRPRHTTSR